MPVRHSDNVFQDRETRATGTICSVNVRVLEYS